MLRRDFLRAGVLSGAAALVPELAKAEEVVEQKTFTTEFALEEATIAELQRDMVSGK